MAYRSSLAKSLRILFVLPRPLQPELQVREYNFLRLLAPVHELTLVTVGNKPANSYFDVTSHKLCSRWVHIKVSIVERLISAIKSWALGDPLMVGLYCPNRVIEQIANLVSENTFDVLHVQTAMMAPVAAVARGLPKILDFVDSLGLKLARRSRIEASWLRPIWRVEAKRMQKYERKQTGIFDRQIMTSSVDKFAISKTSAIDIVPNGVELEKFPYVEGRFTNDIVFIGTMSYSPNVDAAIYFARKVFPLIRKSVPEARFLIVGANPSKKVQQLSRIPGIKVTGYVPSVHKYLAEAAVAVAPLRMGSGIQNKILEAMASGTPVVTTSLALGGIEAVPGEHVKVGNNPQELSNEIIHLLRDRREAIRIARNARRLIEEKYSWERSVAMLEKAYELAIKGGQA